MGKGDQRIKKGKRIMGTYGNSRKVKHSAPIVESGNEENPDEVGSEVQENTTISKEVKKA